MHARRGGLSCVALALALLALPDPRSGQLAAAEPVSQSGTQSLPGTQAAARTQPLTGEHDFAAEIVDGADKYLLERTEKSIERRGQFWQRDISSPAAYAKSIEPNRARLAQIGRSARCPAPPRRACIWPARPSARALRRPRSRLRHSGGPLARLRRRRGAKGCCSCRPAATFWPTWWRSPTVGKRPSNSSAWSRACRPKANTPGGWPNAAVASWCRC